MVCSPTAGLLVWLRWQDARMPAPKDRHPACVNHHPRGWTVPRGRILARGCRASANATLHISSFRSRASYGSERNGASAGSAAARYGTASWHKARPRAADRPRAGGSGTVRREAELMQPRIQDGVHAGTRAVGTHRHVGLEALALDPDLVRREPTRHGQVDAAEFVRKGQPLLNDAFAEGIGADQLGRAACLKRASQDFGRGGGVAVNQYHHVD